MQASYFWFPIAFLGGALFTAYVSDFSSAIGLLLCIAAFLFSFERTMTAHSEKNRLFFVLGILLILVSMISFMFYHAIMTWDYGPFYLPASE